MTSSLSRRVFAALVATALAVTLPSPVSAARPQVVPDVVRLGSASSDTLLATPAEVARAGGNPAMVAAQRAAWAALPLYEAHLQKLLNAREHSRYSAAFKNIVRVAGSPNSARTISPMASQAYCASGSYSSYYKLMSDRQGVQCFAGSAGTYTLKTAFEDAGSYTSIRLSPGGYKGRSLYYFKGVSSWTVTRGPNDHSWYYFTLPPDGNYSIRVYAVQLM